MNETYFTAEQAKNTAIKAIDIESEYLKRETINILKQIEDKAKNGGFELYIYKDNKVILNRLKNLGYSVVVSHDQRDGVFVKISW